ncbi:actin-5 [Strongylocentrotus purpuratus]|uniref:Actin n=1 Tax=Strongylocentrotus purpuratus TaxID=7668 RepID=A0A7M7NMD4_STRPU|nr:actin-5 [Strongylocentrotus purpuratus]
MSESDEEDAAVVVVDNGSGSIKAGFAGDDAPRCVFPSMIGRPKYQKMIPTSMITRDHFVGDEAQRKRGLLSIKYPIERGIVTNWEDMETIWHHTFYNELRVDPKELLVFFTDVPKSTKASREKTTQIMFEKFGAKGFHVCTQGVLSHCAAGRTMSVMLDIGDGVISVVPVFEGYIITPAVHQVNFGGRDLTQHMMKMLNDRGYSFVTTAEREVVREIKEKVCYIAQDFEKEMLGSSALTKTYTLPDLHDITLGNEIFRVPEILFQPSLADRDHASVHKLVYDAIMKCDIDLRVHLYCNVFLVGGSTMFPGFQERLQKELSAMFPQKAKVRVNAPPERKYTVWIGGSILASLSNFKESWITKKEYDEHGPSVVHKKCTN